MRRVFARIGKWFVGLFLLALLFYIADLGKIVSNISRTNLSYYAAASGIFLTIYLWSGLRWQSLIKGLGYDISLAESLKVIAISYGFNKVLPFNSGDLARSKIMERYTAVDSHGKLLGAVGMERVLDLIVVGAMTVTAGISLLGSMDHFFWVLIPAGFLVVSMFVARVWSEKLRRTVGFFESFGLPDRFAELVKESINGYNEISVGRLAEASIWHVLRWAAAVLSMYVLGLSLGTPISMLAAAFTIGVINLVAAMPITPGGLGPVEASGTGALVLAGLSTSAAVSLVVLQRSLGLVLMALIGILVYVLDQ